MSVKKREQRKIIMKNKAVRIAVRSLAVTLAIIFFLLFIVYFGEKVLFARFFINADRELKTHGLSDGYVPQGFEYMEERGVFLACGYMKDKSASRVYVISEETRKVLFFAEMKKSNGSDHTGHTGGIAYYGDYIYITAAEGCDMFKISDLFDGDGIITKCGEVNSYLDPAYCNVYDGKIYMGSFSYPDGGYVTDEEQHITTPAGDNNVAMIEVYELDNVTGKSKSDTPVHIYSTTGKVQGMTMLDGDNMMLSTSWGLTASYLYEYDLGKAKTGECDYHGSKIPVTYLDTDCLTDAVKAPPMAEEIVYLDNKVYVMTESASAKYIFGNLTSGRRVWAYER